MYVCGRVDWGKNESAREPVMMVNKDRTAMIIGYIILDINKMYTRYVVSRVRVVTLHACLWGWGATYAVQVSIHPIALSSQGTVYSNVNKTWG